MVLAGGAKEVPVLPAVAFDFRQQQPRFHAPVVAPAAPQTAFQVVVMPSLPLASLRQPFIQHGLDFGE
jgi:hypothetical protein